MPDFTCPFCGLKEKETMFLEGICPACCRDLETGEEVKGAIPTVFYMPQENKEANDA